MNIVEKETRTETRTYTKIIDCKCDKCGNSLERIGSYHEREFRLEFKHGKAWPDGSGDWTGWEVEDLCDDCVSVLHDLLESNGFTIKKIEEYW